MRSTRIFRAMLAAGLLTSASVMASPINLPAGPFFVQYNNAEQFSPTNTIATTAYVPGAGIGGAVTEGNWGILQVSTIQHGTAFFPPGSDIGGAGGMIFVDGQNGGDQITGIFYGVTSVGAGNSIGGRVDLYWQENNATPVNVSTELTSGANLAKRTDQRTYTGFADPDTMTLLGSFDFRPGCDLGHVNTVCSPTTPGTANGTAQSYQDINLAAGGVWATALDTNYFTLDATGGPMGTLGAADIRTNSNFDGNGATAWNATTSSTNVIIGLRSSDPIRGVAIPEPGTLALLGLSLLGFAGLRRRKSA